MADEKLIRGIHTVPLRDFIHTRYDDDVQRRIYDSLQPKTRELLESVMPDDWHSIDIVSDMNNGIYTAQGDPARGYEEVVKAGGSVAEYGVNTFMRLLIKLMTPEMLAKKWPTIWTKSHNFGQMKAEVPPGEERKLTLYLSDVKEYRYVGPTAVGFLSFSLKAMGKQDARVEERDRDYAVSSKDLYTFDVSW